MARPGDDATPRRGRDAALAFTAYLLLAALASYPLITRLADHVCGFGQPGRMSSATPPLNIWAMAMVMRQLVGDPLHLYEGTAFYPYHDTVTFSEHLFVPALISAPLAWSSGNWVLAYNVTMLLTLASAGLGMFLLAREVSGDRTAAFAAGLLYAFHTWNINELVRSQITANQWFPFVLWGLLRYFSAPGWGWAWRVGLFYLLQSLSCMYWGLYLPFVAAAAGGYLWRRSRRGWRELLPLAAALAAALALTAPFVYPYVRVARELGFERPEPFSVPVDRYLDVLPQNLLYAGLLGTALRNQNAAHFLGLLAIGLAALGAWRGRTGGLRPLLVGLAAAGFLLSLGPQIVVREHVLGPGPYALLRGYVPGFRNVRYPERLSLFLVLGLAPLMAAGLARLRPRLGRSGLVLLTTAVFAEHLSVPVDTFPLPGGAQVPEVYRWLAGRDEARVVAEVPASGFSQERADALPMYYSVAHGKRTVQGYTSYFAPTYNFIKWRLFHFPAPESVAFLERFGVDTVIVAPDDAGALPAWARGGHPRWTRFGPFAEGHVVLRLDGAGGQGYAPPPVDDDEYVEVPRDGWSVWASAPGAAKAIDGDIGTAWVKPGTQEAGDTYRVVFPRTVSVARVRLDVRTTLYQSYNFPLRLQLQGRGEAGGWQALAYPVEPAYDRFFAALLHRPRSATLDLDIPPTPLRALRLRITESDPFWLPWTLPELRVYERR